MLWTCDSNGRKKFVIARHKFSRARESGSRVYQAPRLSHQGRRGVSPCPLPARLTQPPASPSPFQRQLRHCTHTTCVSPESFPLASCHWPALRHMPISKPVTGEGGGSMRASDWLAPGRFLLEAGGTLRQNEGPASRSVQKGWGDAE